MDNWSPLKLNLVNALLIRFLIENAQPLID